MLLNILLNASPLDFWRDPIWQSVGVGIAILFGIISIFLWRLDRQMQNKQKEITYTIVDTPIASVSEAVKDKIELRFEGKVVEDVSLVTLAIVNTGNSAVRREDYEVPIKFELGGRTYLTGEVVRMQPEDLIKPEDLKEVLTPQPDGVSVLPLLLNPLDSVGIKMLVAGQGKIRGTARIVGGKITENDPERQPITLSIWSSIVKPGIGCVGMMVGLIVLLVVVNLPNLFSYLPHPFDTILDWIWGIALMLAFLILLIILLTGGLPENLRVRDIFGFTRQRVLFLIRNGTKITW